MMTLNDVITTLNDTSSENPITRNYTKSVSLTVVVIKLYKASGNKKEGQQTTFKQFIILDIYL